MFSTMPRLSTVFLQQVVSMKSRAKTTLVHEYIPQERGQRVSVGLEGAQQDKFVLVAAYLQRCN